MGNKLSSCILAMSLIGFISGCSSDSTGDSKTTGAGDTEQRITKAEYEKIKNGMTYEEVTEIIGSKGVEATDQDEPDTKAEVYRFEGAGKAGADVHIYFKDGKVEGKEQEGLE
ncbi:DUF3862 domain-containing protein [Peribacillus sp. SCS-155]|uniref:DUF3862 domain-containing protein n=1 Tax=Peribacillus sedimenti TaxID=3115297 RepID=UPI003905BC50